MGSSSFSVWLKCVNHQPKRSNGAHANNMFLLSIYPKRQRKSKQTNRYTTEDSFDDNNVDAADPSICYDCIEG